MRDDTERTLIILAIAGVIASILFMVIGFGVFINTDGRGFSLGG